MALAEHDFPARIIVQHGAGFLAAADPGVGGGAVEFNHLVSVARLIVLLAADVGAGLESTAALLEYAQRLDLGGRRGNEHLHQHWKNERLDQATMDGFHGFAAMIECR